MNIENIKDWRKKDFIPVFVKLGSAFNCTIMWNTKSSQYFETGAWGRCYTIDRVLVLTKPRHLSNKALIHNVIHELTHLLLEHSESTCMVNWGHEFVCERVATIVTEYVGEWDTLREIQLVDYAVNKIKNFQYDDYIDEIKLAVSKIKPIFDKL
jgi:hypothetical protein